MSRVYVGNLDNWIDERVLEDEFIIYGVIKSIWIPKRQPGYAFIEFADHRCAQDAIRALDGKNGWRVEIARNPRGSEVLRCYKCGEAGHYARECNFRATRRIRSISPDYGYGRRTRSRTRTRSHSPRRRSSKPRSLSLRPRAISRSPPPYRGRDESPYANWRRDRHRRRS